MKIKQVIPIHLRTVCIYAYMDVYLICKSSLKFRLFFDSFFISSVVRVHTKDLVLVRGHICRAVSLAQY